MTNYALMFVNPLLLLLLIPALGVALVPFFLVPKKYRYNRNRVVSLILHCTAMVIAVFLLAGVTYSYDIPNKENELILLIDCSDSNEGSIDAKNEFIETIVDICGENYKLGIVKFGYEQLYVAELSNDTDEVYRKYMESADPDTSATDIASALKYASTLFKTPSTGKIVLVSDGIETDSSAMSVIKSISAEGIKVDTVYYPNETKDEVQIVGVKMPEYKITIGSPFTIALDLKSNFGLSDLLETEATSSIVNLTVYDNEVPGEPMQLILEKGELTVDITHKFDLPGMHALRFEISNPIDSSAKNNSYYTYVKLDDLNNILLIERRSGESEKLQTLLADTYGFNVEAMGIDTDFADIPRTVKELCAYEQVILVNIANSDLPTGFDEILYRYVNQFGGGLLTVGGENDEGTGESEGKLIPHAYNSEDLANTLLAEMMPVQAIDYTPPIAVMIVIDCSGSMSMGKFEQAQIGAKACLDALSPRDYCGVMSFDTEAGEEISVIPVSQKDKIIRAINEVGKGQGTGSGGTIFSIAIDNAGRALAATDVERRHIIVVTDGNPSDTIDEYGPYIDNNVKSGITMSVVGIQIANDNIENMENTCKRAGGTFYNVPASELNNLPSIMHKDMEMEAISGIRYGEDLYIRIKEFSSAIAGGIKPGEIPPLTGYYGTRVKEGATEYLSGARLLSEGNSAPSYSVPIYAQWKFGNGSVGSFMSDLDGIWSEKFMNDVVGQTLIANIVRNLFPNQAIKTDEIDALIRQDNYSVQVSVSSVREEGDTVGVSITPLTQEAMLFYQNPIPVSVADGFTRFTFDITCPGVYEIRIDKKDANGEVLATLTLYYTFSYSQEYNYFPDKELMGEEFMSALAVDGRGIVVEYAIDIFDAFEKDIHKTVDPRIGLLIALIILVLLDIAVRKFKFKWPHEIVRDYKVKKAEKAKHSDK